MSKVMYIYCVDNALGKYLKIRIDFVSENIKFNDKIHTIINYELLNNWFKRYTIRV